MAKRMLNSVFWFFAKIETWEQAIAFFGGLSLAIAIWIAGRQRFSFASWAMFLGTGYLFGFLARFIFYSFKADESDGVLISLFLGYSIGALTFFVISLLGLA